MKQSGDSKSVDSVVRADLDFPRTRNRDDIVALCEQPRERNLAGRRVVLLADCADRVDELQDPREVLLREPVELGIDQQPAVSGAGEGPTWAQCA